MRNLTNIPITHAQFEEMADKITAIQEPYWFGPRLHGVPAIRLWVINRMDTIAILNSYGVTELQYDQELEARLGLERLK